MYCFCTIVKSRSCNLNHRNPETTCIWLLTGVALFLTDRIGEGNWGTALGSDKVIRAVKSGFFWTKNCFLTKLILLGSLKISATLFGTGCRIFALGSKDGLQRVEGLS